MKKLISIMILIVMLIACTVSAMAVEINVNGSNVGFNDNYGYPFIDSANRTQVPLRVTMQKCGCTVYWDNARRVAMVKRDSNLVEVPIGQKYIMVNGVKKENDTVAVIKNDRTYLPIRAVLEAFGALVDWDAPNQTVLVNIDSPKYMDYDLSKYITLPIYKGLNLMNIGITSSDENAIKDGLWYYVLARTTVKAYPEKEVNCLYLQQMRMFESEAIHAGYPTLEAYAKSLGCKVSDLEADALKMARETVKGDMVATQIARLDGKDSMSESEYLAFCKQKAQEWGYKSVEEFQDDFNRDDVREFIIMDRVEDILFSNSN